MTNVGNSDHTANAEAIAILQLLHEQEKFRLIADVKQKDDTIKDLNIKQKNLEKELCENKALVETQKSQIEDINQELLKVIFMRK